MPNKKKNRGFAAMNAEKQREAARKGGEATREGQGGGGGGGGGQAPAPTERGYTPTETQRQREGHKTTHAMPTIDKKRSETR